MNNYLIYIAFLFIECIVVGSIAAYLVSLLYSSFMGAPYVPSKQKAIEETLKKAKLKKNQLFLELGSGDGRAVRTAVKLYSVEGIGIDVNPLLVWWSKFLSDRSKLKNISFLKKNILKYDLSKADVIYLFLMPEFIKKLLSKFDKEIKKDTLVISHGFKIPTWEKYCFYTLERSLFSTYFYRKSHE